MSVIQVEYVLLFVWDDIAGSCNAPLFINVRCQSFPCDPNGKTLWLHNNALQNQIWVIYANCKFLCGQSDPETSGPGKIIDTTIEQKV